MKTRVPDAFNDGDLLSGLMPQNVKMIVLAEDDPEIARLTKFKLEREGYEVIWEKDGEAALKSIKEKLPDLVILDIMMPVMDGFLVLKKIKEDTSIMNIPVIILSAKGQENDVVRGIEMGSVDYVVKPFRTAELTARIKRIIKNEGA